jgi:hypothetical protein
MESKQLSGDTEKPQDYLREYERAFASIANNEVKVLELGVHKGGSLFMWRDYFARGPIVGLDVNAVEIDDPTGRIHVYQGYQEDTALLTRIAQEQAQDGFDVIVDDCRHIGELAKISFWHLFKYHLKPGGIYAIEDWGTGYWSGHSYYPDGRRFHEGEEAIETIRDGSLLESGLRKLSHWRIVKQSARLQRLLSPYQYVRRFSTHEYGMVGFIKQLVDECGIMDISNSDWGNPPQRPSRISRMVVRHGLVIVFKALI